MSEIVGLAIFISFGAWWAVAPQNVIDFYARFRASFRPPKLLAVRVIGLLWILLVVAVFGFSGRR